jgi:hypothetical protein
MFHWFEQSKPKVPEWMIQLTNMPVDVEGIPAWNAEIETATQRFGTEFVAPFMFEISPGTCLGGYAAKATLKTPVRTYEARATLIQRKNNDFRTNVLITAPGVPPTQIGDTPWNPYSRSYNTSLPKNDLPDLVNTIRQLCDQSHAEELHDRQTTSVARSSENRQQEYGRIKVNISPWTVIRGTHNKLTYNELNRVYDFDNLAGPGSTTKIELRCRLDVNAVEQGPKSLFKFSRPTKVTPFVYLVIQPHLIEPTEHVMVFFAPTGEIKNYELLGAKLEKAPDGNVCFLVFDISDGEQLLSVLMRGRQITLRILQSCDLPVEWLKAVLDENGPAPYIEASLAHAVLENDTTFQREYEALKDALLNATP